MRFQAAASGTPLHGDRKSLRDGAAQVTQLQTWYDRDYANGREGVGRGGCAVTTLGTTSMQVAAQLCVFMLVCGVCVCVCVCSAGTTPIFVIRRITPYLLL